MSRALAPLAVIVLEDRDTADLVSGSKHAETSFTEHWTLAIDGPADNPWRIVDAA